MRSKITLFVFVMSILLLFAFGCASRDYVRQQIDPLVDRISKIEEMECCDKADRAAQKAEDAAQRAEEAAQRAESAALKAAKAFELQQAK